MFNFAFFSLEKFNFKNPSSDREFLLSKDFFDNSNYLFNALEDLLGHFYHLGGRIYHEKGHSEDLGGGFYHFGGGKKHQKGHFYHRQGGSEHYFNVSKH